MNNSADTATTIMEHQSRPRWFSLVVQSALTLHNNYPARPACQRNQWDRNPNVIVLPKTNTLKTLRPRRRFQLTPRRLFRLLPRHRCHRTIHLLGRGKIFAPQGLTRRVESVSEGENDKSASAPHSKLMWKALNDVISMPPKFAQIIHGRLHTHLHQNTLPHQCARPRQTHQTAPQTLIKTKSDPKWIINIRSTRVLLNTDSKLPMLSFIQYFIS